MKEYRTKLIEKKEYSSGATRDNSSGKGRFDLVPDLALLRLTKVYERGADNHGARNWEAGIPFSRLVDSALRHIIQYKMTRYVDGLNDEDHLSQAVWNLMAIMHEEEMINKGALPEELDDLPTYINQRTKRLIEPDDDEERFDFEDEPFNFED